MPSWNELLATMSAISENERAKWLTEQQQKWLTEISKQRDGRNVIFYASAFLQKPVLPAPALQLMPEEINGFMAVMHGMDWKKQLTLILHTPGGVTTAAETIVSYLHRKFDKIEVIVPTYAMSAGTMISLGADKIIMGRQSQLGPIDAQLPVGGRWVSSRAVVE